MKGSLVAPVLGVLLAVSTIGGLALFSPARQVSGGFIPSKITSAGPSAQYPVPSTQAAIGSGASNPALLSGLFVVLGAATLIGSASALVSKRRRTQNEASE